MARAIFYLFLLLAMEISFTTGVKRICVLHYELQSFVRPEIYANAKRACEDSGRYLAKISTVEISEALKNVLTPEHHYYIGLTLNNGYYKWEDEELIGSFQNWKSGANIKQACVVADGGDGGKWVDYGCSYKTYFVCQRTLTASANIGFKSFLINDENDEISCSTPIESICSTTVTWFDPNENVIPTSSSSDVYQIDASTPTEAISKLVLTKADISHEGSYVCKAQVGTEEASKTVKVFISPIVEKITLSDCSAQLNISWTPNRAQNYSHLLKVFPTSNETKKRELKFNASETYNVTLNDLKPNTEYTIEISVCKTNACLHENPAKRTITTEGKPRTVSSANMSSAGLKCSIEWNPPTNKWNKITGYKVHVTNQLVESRNNITNDTKSYDVTDTSNVFNARPNMKYVAEIRAVNCAGIGDSVAAAGFCASAAQAPDNIKKPIITHPNGGTNVTFKIPIETNGLISCLLVVVSEKVGGTSQELNLTEFNSTIRNETANEYIAIAIAPFRFVGKSGVEMTLGDNSNSYCVFNDARFNGNITAVDNSTLIEAENKPLSQSKEYSVFIVAVVPTAENYVLESSPEAIIDWTAPPTEPTEPTGGVVTTVPTTTTLKSTTTASTRTTTTTAQGPSPGTRTSEAPATISTTLSTVENSSGSNTDRSDTYTTTVTLSRPHTDGDTGSEKTTREDGVNTWLIGVIIALVVIVLIVTVLFLYRRKKATWRVRNTVKSRPALTSLKPIGEELPGPSDANVEIVMDGDDGPYANFVPENTKSIVTAIALSELSSVYHRKRSNSNNEFSTEFQRLAALAAKNVGSTSVASDEALKSKNRYKNILPFNDSRVPLSGTESGYINACYIDGFNKKPKFIATQGPLPETLDDFWLMAFEQNSSVIVMLTKLEEAGKKKCEKYWPEVGTHESYGSLTVENVKEESFNSYLCRTFTVLTSDKSRTIMQFQFLTWPDHGVPETSSSLLRMYKAIVDYTNKSTESGPIIVHCSAGAGRTGTFIGYDILFEETQTKDQVDIFNCVLDMRRQRVDMVQTINQYVMIHKIILEAYLFQDTDCSMEELKTKCQEMETYDGTAKMLKEFENLDQVPPMNDTTAIGDQEENNEMNMPGNIVPYDYSRIRVVIQDGEFASPYINASNLESYDEEMNIIAAQGPMDNTVEVFWRAILDNDVCVVVMLTKDIEKKKEQCVRYWPTGPGDQVVFGNITVTLSGDEVNGPVVKRKFLVERGEDKVNVTQIHFTIWEKGTLPENPKEIIDLALSLRQELQKSPGKAGLVHCSDGIGRTGAFCTIFNLMDRLKKENRVDVFRAVKDLRDGRPKMVNTLELYQFCYQVLDHYIKSFELYANF